MEFVISKNALQKELGFVQGIVERKNTIPVLSNILIESVGENNLRITGTDLDVTIRCETEADLRTPGSMCVGARKLFEIARVLPDAPVHFRKEENNWASVKCERSNFRIAGVERDTFPELPAFRSTPIRMPADIFKTFIDRTIFAITLEESRYTLSGAKFMLDSEGARMVTTDGHRLAYIERQDLKEKAVTEPLDALIPRKTLAELVKLTTGYEGDIGLGADSNHIYFEVGSRLLISRTLTGQFPNYEMVIPKDNDKRAIFDAEEMKTAIRRVSLMADERTRSVRLTIRENEIEIGAQSSEEGEANEKVTAEYTGEEVQVGFNAQYLQEFLNVVGAGEAEATETTEKETSGETVRVKESGSRLKIAFEFKDGNAQTQMNIAGDKNYDYKYIVMPLRI